MKKWQAGFWMLWMGLSFHYGEYAASKYLFRIFDNQVPWLAAFLCKRSCFKALPITLAIIRQRERERLRFFSLGKI